MWRLQVMSEFEEQVRRSEEELNRKTEEKDRQLSDVTRKYVTNRPK